MSGHDDGVRWRQRLENLERALSRSRSAQRHAPALEALAATLKAEREK